MLPDSDEGFETAFRNEIAEEEFMEIAVAEDEPVIDEPEPAPAAPPKYEAVGGSVFEIATGRRCYRFSTKAEAQACADLLNGKG
jgi:hypothetical protein